MNYEILIRLLLAALWGGIVGIEREYRGKSAGFRTLIMISMGSCFFTMMSQFIGGVSNPDRIASNIVTGIGFLGAGVIFRGENRVNGITTAATIWVVAAVGMGIGAGRYISAACASILILFVLAILPYMERRIDRWNKPRTYQIKCEYKEDTIRILELMLKRAKLKYNLFSQTKDGKDVMMRWTAQGNVASHQRFVDELMQDEKIKYFDY